MPTNLRLEALVSLAFGVQLRFERPVLNRFECRDLALAFDDQSHSNSLHAARGESPANLVPQQRRYLIADEAVEHTACLLRIYEILVDVAGVLERVLHGLLRDLIKGDAANLLPFFGGGSQLNSQVRSDRFAFAVRVRRKEDFISLGRPAFFN